MGLVVLEYHVIKCDQCDSWTLLRTILKGPLKNLNNIGTNAHTKSYP